MQTGRWASFILCAAMYSCPADAQSAMNLEYPLVFDRVAELRELGFMVGGHTIDSPYDFAWSDQLSVQCYFYGYGGIPLSVSQDVLARFEARGFSKRSMCMGLVSGIRYDPENGRRLPTYLLYNVELVTEFTEDDGTAGVAIGELPLDLPDCFNRGVPYDDCAINFDPMSGKKVTKTATLAHRKLGSELKAWLAPLASEAIPLPPLSSSQPDLIPLNGMMGVPIGVLDPSFQLIYETISPEITLWPSFADFSDQFPQGYGYALNADGIAGPGTSSEAVQLSRTKKLASSKQKLALLKAVLK